MLRLLADEDVHGDIVRGLRRRQPALDLLRVQDVGLSQTPDAVILEWAAQQGRVVVSVDKKTLAWDEMPPPCAAGANATRLTLTPGAMLSRP